MYYCGNIKNCVNTVAPCINIKYRKHAINAKVSAYKTNGICRLYKNCVEERASFSKHIQNTGVQTLNFSKTFLITSAAHLYFVFCIDIHLPSYFQKLYLGRYACIYSANITSLLVSLSLFFFFNLSHKLTKVQPAMYPTLFQCYTNPSHHSMCVLLNYYSGAFVMKR